MLLNLTNFNETFNLQKIQDTMHRLRIVQIIIVPANRVSWNLLRLNN